MSKLPSKNKCEPLTHPMPDITNKNIIKGTASPVKQVRLFLEKAKLHQKLPSQVGTAVFDFAGEEDLTGKYARNEEILRKRINDLQRENNEFRSFAMEYEVLVDRNKNLQQQMLLLLEQLEQHSLEEQSFSRNRHMQPSKQQYNTTESSHHEDSKNSSNSQEIKVIKSFNSYEEQDLIEENNYLKAENERIQQLVDKSIKQSIRNLEEKFMSYVSAMEEKLSILSATNLEISKLRLKEEEQNSSKSSNQNTGKLGEWEKNNDHVSHEVGVQSNYANSENSGFSLNPKKMLQHSSKIRSSSKGNLQVSKIDIEISSLSESNQSFKNSNKKNLYPTPGSKDNSFFKHIELIQSQKPNTTFYQQTIVQKIYENLYALRANLTAVFATKDQSLPQYLQQTSNKIEVQLKDMLRFFFSYRGDLLNSEEHEVENRLMRKKIGELTSEINLLKRDLKLKTEQPMMESQCKLASERYLQQSYYLNLESQQYRQFQESKQKLIEVIDIMKSFNRDYRYLINQNDSLMLQSIQKK